MYSSPGSYTATLTVTDNATWTDPNPPSRTITVNPAPGPPTLTSISPGYVIQNTATTVTLNGTNFVPGNTTINNSYTGLSISNVTVAGSTSLTATFTVAANAPIGSTTFSVTTPSGTSSKNVGIDIIGVPILNSISPASGRRGTSFTVTLTGSQFMRAQIKFSGTGIAASNRTVNFPMFTVLTYTFTIASNAPTGPQNVTLTNAAGTSAPMTFTVQ
jgi:hypothetical protein